MSALSLRGVGKRFGPVVAAADITFDVDDGELLVLLGPSGCGKSTLLRLVCGLETPDEGRIECGGRLLNDEAVQLPPEARKISLVFQDNALFPHMTVCDNVAFGLHGRPNGTRTQRVSEVLDMVRLEDVVTRFPHELSGGQQQRVALARALAPEPALVLLDEPFSDLDRTLRLALREEVRDVFTASGTAAILVTHDQEEALVMGDRIAVQRAGRIEQIGAPETLFSDPASRFVAEFVGEADFVSGEVTDDGIQTEIGRLIQATGATTGTAVDVAIRADDIAVHPDPSAPATVVSRAFTGMVNKYRVRLPSGAIVHSLQPHTLNLAEGTRVDVRAEPGHALACFPTADWAES